MTDTTTLTDSQKLDRLLAIAEKLAAGALTAPAVTGEPPNVRELTLADIDPRTIDGKFIQLDGSTWAYMGWDKDKPAAPGQWIYGYISEHKDPDLWRAMVATFGGDEARLREVLAVNGKFARYKAHPKTCLGNFILMSMLLGSATPETQPSPPSAIREAAKEDDKPTPQEAPQAPRGRG